jgi:hypothetical protein
VPQPLVVVVLVEQEQARVVQQVQQQLLLQRHWVKWHVHKHLSQVTRVGMAEQQRPQITRLVQDALF